MTIPTIAEFTVDIEARAARHISGAVVRFYPFVDDATWRASIPETIEHANRFEGSLDDLVRVAQEAAIAAGMTHKKP